MRGSKYISITLFIIGGFLFIGGLILMFRTESFNKNAIKTQGIVQKITIVPDTVGTNNGSTYKPTVKFRTGQNNEIIYTPTHGFVKNKYVPGDSISIMYNPENQLEIKLIDEYQTFATASATAFVLGFFMFLIGFVIILRRRTKKRFNKNLRENGKLIKANYEKYHENIWSRWIGTSPYYLVCSYTENDKIYNFVSEIFYIRNFDPEKYLKNNEIDVYVDPKNYNKYYVDISFIPQSKIF